MHHPYRITIDGPAASGKSTLGSTLAARLGYPCIDTGLFYRAVAWLVYRVHVNPDDEEACAALAGSEAIQLQKRTLLGGNEIDALGVSGMVMTDSLHTYKINTLAPIVASHPQVREVVTARLREMSKLQSVVMMGRDCGTVVLPEAELKIYLTASLEERSRRRYEEWCAQRPDERLPPLRLEQIQEALRQRDEQDQNRLYPAKDALVLQTDHLSQRQVYEMIAHLLAIQGLLDDQGAR